MQNMIYIMTLSPRCDGLPTSRVEVQRYLDRKGSAKVMIQLTRLKGFQKIEMQLSRFRRLNMVTKQLSILRRLKKRVNINFGATGILKTILGGT